MHRFAGNPAFSPRSCPKKAGGLPKEKRMSSPSHRRLPSAILLWPPLARFAAGERRLASWAAREGGATFAVYEFARFVIKQGWACLFGALMLALLFLTQLFYPQDAALARYDFLFFGALAIQAGMLAFRLETWDEAKVILAFHVVGTAMEIFKTSVGSWIYPEPSVFRIGGVPLFSGFLYAAVGSYLARVWRLFDFRFTRHPPVWAVSLLAVAIYANFFAHHYLQDVRVLLFAAAAVLFARTWVHYRIWRRHRSMPLLLGLALVATFIWIAENIGTFSRAWIYPHQAGVWTFVSWQKLGAWFLLMLISYALVALVQGVRPAVAEQRANTSPNVAASFPKRRADNRASVVSKR